MESSDAGESGPRIFLRLERTGDRNSDIRATSRADDGVKAMARVGRSRARSVVKIAPPPLSRFRGNGIMSRRFRLAINALYGGAGGGGRRSMKFEGIALGVSFSRCDARGCGRGPLSNRHRARGSSSDDGSVS